MSLNLEEHIRKSREAVAANRAKGNKHAELLSRLYTDPYRFLDEILQNTEDAYARKFADGGRGTVRFLYTEAGLDIVHDGIDFDEEDLKAITTFAGTTKDREDGINQIGKFGIGFRSVYSLTDHPEIHCGHWHFRIDDYEVLEETQAIQPPQGFGTLIRLPFRESEIRTIQKWVREGLDRMNVYSILFLKYIHEVEIWINGKLKRRLNVTRQQLTDSIIKKVVLDISKEEKHIEYIVLHHENEKQLNSCAIAFRLSRNADGNEIIVREENPYLFVYFPTKQESHLGFIVHARFTTTPTREAIPFDPIKTPENFQLISRAASLLSQSLVPLRNLGLANASLFSVLPVIPLNGPAGETVYELFHKEMIHALRQKKILPVHSGTHGLAREMAFTMEPAIMDLLDSRALQLFYQRSLWLHEDFQPLTAMAKALASLCDIREADTASVAFRISVHPDFLGQKPVKWFKNFYAFLATRPELWDGLHKHEHYSLRYQPIIRLKSGENVAAFDRNDQPLVALPSGKRTKPGDIHPEILKDEVSLNFLQMLGLKTRSSVEPTTGEIEWICESGARKTADEMDLSLFSPEKIDLAKTGAISLLAGMRVLGDFGGSSDPFREMLFWSVECAAVLLKKKYPGSECSGIKPDSARLHLQKNGTSRSVYVACRVSGQHRYHIPAEDWTGMFNEVQGNSLLLLISDAGTARATALLIEDPGIMMKQGHFISDPVGFNLLDL